MKITRVEAKNFRALEAITLAKAASINVIVGPNAVGKSTLLDVIRLPKSILVPRINSEAQQALIGLGVLSPQNPAIAGPGLDLDALANVKGQPIRATVELTLNATELGFLRDNIEQIALLNLQAEMARPDSDTVLAFTQFLSTPAGRARVQQLSADAKAHLDQMTESSVLRLALVMNGASRSIHGEDIQSQMMVAVLDRGLPFQTTYFSLFPADRAFPPGEQPLQVGTADAQQHLLAHMAQPGLKYARLKQVIIQGLLLSPNGREVLANEFNLIFDHLLPGKKLAGIEINEYGLMKITVFDQNMNKTFDIDFMSSGEKGLVLTFLFLRLSMQEGGVALIDEPELHLNSAVCEKILPFLIEHCVEPKKLQVFICTHSPEIVRQAVERDDCALYHLRSGTDLTPVLKQDQNEVFEIFNRLGSSPADVFFTKGGIYVEGVDDGAILKAGFGEMLAGYKITALGGRGEIHREVPALQAEENKKNLSKVQLFILDNDRNPTKLNSTAIVRVRQLKRYCIENYLLDDDILFDVVSAHKEGDIESRGNFPKALQQIAFLQIVDLAIIEVYDALKPEGAGIRKEDLKDKSIEEIADLLANRLFSIKSVLDEFDRDAWVQKFKADVDIKKGEMEAQWMSSWKELASGKIIIDELYRKYQIRMKKPEFKREVMMRMAKAETDDWRILRDLLTSGLN